MGDLSFSPNQIHTTNWSKINTTLAGNAEKDNQGNHEWLSEDVGWKHSTISICVSFHHCMAVPGLQSYLAGELYHWSIIP